MSQNGAFSEFLKEHIQDLDNNEELLELQRVINDKDVKILLETRLSNIVEDKP